MSLAENISERLSYKFYASAAIGPTEPSPASDPGASGAQQLRFVSQDLSLQAANIANNEKRTDRQRSLGRQGTRRGQGSIRGLLSPGTYGDFFEAALRGTWAAAVTAGPTDFTSISADASASTFTWASGNPVTEGFRVGMAVEFTGLSDADNNGRLFTILEFSGGSNRTIKVFPAPDTMTADTDCTMASAGSHLIIPASSHVSRKLAIESYQSDIDVAELFTEGRIGGFNLGAQADNPLGLDFTILARNRAWYNGTNAPFFSSPAAQTSTDICSPVGGVIYANGAAQGVVTALSLGLQLNPNGPSVIGPRIVPEIFLGDAAISGNLSFFYEDSDLIETFDDETEIAVLAQFPSGGSDGYPDHVVNVFLPRVKLGSASKTEDGSGGKIVSAPFEAGRYFGAGAGIESTALQIHDTAITP